jgi:hypothetical protein
MASAGSSRHRTCSQLGVCSRFEESSFLTRRAETLTSDLSLGSNADAAGQRSAPGIVDGPRVPMGEC